MYALQTSQDGKNFNNYFQKGRLRKYESMQNALNASKQLLNNPKNKIHTILVYDPSFKGTLAWVKRDEQGNSIIKYSKWADQSSEETKKKIPIEELIDQPDKLFDRRKILEEGYKRHKEKKKKEIKAGYCLNNLSDSSLKKAEDSFYGEFMAAAIEQSIKTQDYRTLFYTEQKLSQIGYSWFVDDDSQIRVKPTKQVIKFLNEQEYV